MSGPLGAGWPDLVLLHVKDRRLIFAELKGESGKVSADQAAVLAALRALGLPCPDRMDGMGPGHWPRPETHLWRPADFDEIVKVLQ